MNTHFFFHYAVYIEGSYECSCSLIFVVLVAPCGLGMGSGVGAASPLSSEATIASTRGAFALRFRRHEKICSFGGTARVLIFRLRLGALGDMAPVPNQGWSITISKCIPSSTSALPHANVTHVESLSPKVQFSHAVHLSLLPGYFSKK